MTIGITDNIIRYMRTAAPLLAPVFRSEGQARLLAALLLNPTELPLIDLASRAELSYATAHSEVARLLEAGILGETRVGRTRLIRANESSPLVPPLREILLVSTGPVVLLAQRLEDVPGVEAAFLYGSYAARMKGKQGPAPRDIDLMVIGSPNVSTVARACSEISAMVHRVINPTILSLDEFNTSGAFAQDVRAKPVVPIVGALPW